MNYVQNLFYHVFPSFLPKDKNQLAQDKAKGIVTKLVQEHDNPETLVLIATNIFDEIEQHIHGHITASSKRHKEYSKQAEVLKNYKNEL